MLRELANADAIGFDQSPAAGGIDDSTLLGESSRSIAASAVACSLLLAILVIAFAVLARAATPGWSIDTHRQPGPVARHPSV